MKMFRILLACAALCFIALPVAITLTGCQTAQSVAYQTLSGLEKGNVAAYDAYLDLVLAGKVPTNDLPAISREFNTVQLSIQAAIALAQFNTNAPAPPELVDKVKGLQADITVAKGK